MNPDDLIRQARQRQGLTQSEVARRAGTSQPVVSSYENGHRDPSVATLRRLIRATGLDLDLRLGRIPNTDLPPPVDLHEHARRLVSVLSLIDAIPTRRRPETLDMPRMLSR